MKISFFFPQVYRGIAGGYKLIYEHANHLVSLDNEVTIYYDLRKGQNSHHIPCFIMTFVRKMILWNYPKWFKLSSKVRQIGVPEISEKYVEKGDRYIATSPYTAYPIAALPDSNNKKYYYIQGYENWDGTANDYIDQSYCLGLRNIVVSQWLKEIVESKSKKNATLINNGIDTNVFKCKTNYMDRDKYSICMIYHDIENKASGIGLQVIGKLKKKYSSLKATLFGAPKKPTNLPEWIEYIQNANEEKVTKIMNAHRVFLCTSRREGFGLPGLEAICCGTFLVTTDCLGQRQYADERNSIVCKVDDVDGLYHAVDYIFTNLEVASVMSKNGARDVDKWDIHNCLHQFEEELFK